MLAITLVVVIEPSYRQSLFDSSIDYIKEVQRSTSGGGFVLWKIYTDSIALVVFIPAILGLLRFKWRARAFYYFVTLTSFIFVMSVSKLQYHQARPFWVSPEIEAH